jgi:hypothetical protein
MLAAKHPKEWHCAMAIFHTLIDIPHSNEKAMTMLTLQQQVTALACKIQDQENFQRYGGQQQQYHQSTFNPQQQQQQQQQQYFSLNPLQSTSATYFQQQYPHTFQPRPAATWSLLQQLRSEASTPTTEIASGAGSTGGATSLVAAMGSNVEDKISTYSSM